jgi:hypothetical protein
MPKVLVPCYPRGETKVIRQVEREYSVISKAEAAKGINLINHRFQVRVSSEGAGANMREWQ